MSRRLVKLLSAGALCLGMVLLAARPDLAAAPNPKEAGKYTADLKDGKDPKVRAAALAELGKLGQVQKGLIADAYPYMVKALEDKDAGVRAAAARAVGMVDPDPDAVVPTLTNMAKDEKEKEEVRMAAMQGLAAMGANAKPAVKDLRAVMQKEDKKSKLGKAAQNALKSINVKK